MTTKLTKIARFFAQLEQWRGTYFPERQLFLRSQGRVRFLTIHSYTQIAMASGVLVAVGWGMVTSYAYLSRDHVIEGKNKTISTMSSQYQTLSSDFSALELEVERRAQLLEERQQFLEDILKTGPIDSAAQPAGQPESEIPESQMKDSVDSAATPTPEQTSSLFDNLFTSPPVNAAILTTVDRRKTLLNRLRNMEQRQRTLASLVLEDVRKQLVTVDTTLAPTKLNADDLIRKISTSATAVGGPYVPDQSFNGIFSTSDGAPFLDLKETSDRLKMVTNALDSYPLGKPAEKYYVSSRFGRRRDPIKKTWAKHPGLDLAGWPGTAITATAAGTVIYSGWYGPYGNMVEIDHGNGFRTRYGHMKKLRVKKNEQIDLGHRIGDMGRTGRVTGTHVHYEVWFDDKVRDPMPFIKAAANVLKIQGRHEKTYE